LNFKGGSINFRANEDDPETQTGAREIGGQVARTPKSSVAGSSFSIQTNLANQSGTIRLERAEEVPTSIFPNPDF